jgi:membrane-associated protein
MPYSRFLSFNVIGGAAWVLSMSVLGFLLGQMFDAKTIEKVVYLIIVISVTPLGVGWLRARAQQKQLAASQSQR